MANADWKFLPPYPVPIKEPPLDEEVLVTVSRGGECVTLAGWKRLEDGDGNEGWADSGGEIHGRPVAWMEYPAPARKEGLK